MELKAVKPMILWLFLSSIVGCINSEKENSKSVEIREIDFQDTLVWTKIMTEELPGSAFRKRAIGYYLVVGKDTSSFTTIISESQDQELTLIFKTNDQKALSSHEQRLKELELSLKRASEDFILDSLKSIEFGRLGEDELFAIEMTNQFHARFGSSFDLPLYKDVQDFFLNSTLSQDLNRILDTYHIEIEQIIPEKLHFANHSIHPPLSKSRELPEKILDCMIYLTLKKKDLYFVPKLSNINGHK